MGVLGVKSCFFFKEKPFQKNLYVTVMMQDYVKWRMRNMQGTYPS